MSSLKRLRAHLANGDADDFVGGCTNLEAGGTERAIKQLTATEGGGIADTVQLFLQLSNFVVQCGTLGLAVGAVGGLQRQVAHTLQNIGGLLQSTFGGLRQGAAVVGVVVRNVQAADLAAQTVGNLPAGGI